MKISKIQHKINFNFFIKILKSLHWNSQVTNLKRLVHYGEIDENINDMTFIPYSNALIAAGQSGLYLVDLGMS